MSVRFIAMCGLALMLTPLIARAQTPTTFTPVGVVISTDPLPASQDPDVITVAQGNNAFALSMYSQLAGQADGNLFFSPYSIRSALAMTYNGAAGQTKSQMAKTLDISLGLNRLNGAYFSLANILDHGAPTINNVPAYDLATANALWGQSGFNYNPVFLNDASQYYGAKLHQADFIDDPDAAVQKINAWVANKTDNLIQGLFSEFPPTTRLVLVNAIYFHGNWASQFDATQTKSQMFHRDSGDCVDVPMMRQSETISYMQNRQVQIAQFPYVGNTIAMDIILPKAQDGLDSLEGGLTIDTLNRWFSRLGDWSVMAYVPKFQLTAQFELSQQLAALGMTDAFTNDADFSGMTTDAPLQINQVVHKAYLNVDETGTTAAAVTGVGMVNTVVVIPQGPVTFRANHPFLVVIRELSTGTILFMGRVADPTAN